MARAVAVVLLIVAPAPLVGCGGSGGPSSEGAIEAAERAMVRQAQQDERAAEAKAPAGASPTLRRIYRAFPAPQVDSMMAPSATAGEAACRGKTPVAVKEEFFAVAEGNLEPAQAEMIARIKSYEGQERTDRSFVAGQLAADTYAATRPEATAVAAYQGCVYALARALEQRLAPAHR